MLQNVEKSCRICLKEVLEDNKELIDFQKVAKHSKNSVKAWTYLDLFQLFSGYKVLADEPQQFCTNCSVDLKHAFDFKTICEEAQVFFDSLRQVNDTNVKVEIKEDEAGNGTASKHRLTDALNKIGETLKISVAPSSPDTEINLKEENQLPELDSSMCDESYEIFIEETEPKAQVNQEFEQPYSCEFCSASYKYRKNLMQHYRSCHSDQKIHECFDCKATFYTSSLLESHAITCRKRQRSEKDLQKKKHLCPVCGKPSSNNHILYHQQRHAKQDLNEAGSKQIYICDICGTKVSTRYSMINHMKVQHFNQRTKCKYCDTTFRYPTQLSVHVRRIHRQETPVFKCGKCDFIAPSETYLQRHRTTHSGKKPFNCTICSYQCYKKIEFENHMASHSDARPFVCDVCSSAFKTKKALRTHKKTHGDYDYECPVCSQGFYSNHLMRAHVKKVHPDYEMPPPGTVFSKTALKRLAEKELQEMAMRSGSEKQLIS